MANEVQNRLKDSSMMIASSEIVRRLNEYQKLNALDYSTYGLSCVDNAFVKLNEILVDKNMNWGHFNTPIGINNLFSMAKFIAGLELNVANNEVALTFRNKKINNETVPMLEYKIQGVGNDQIIRKFGANVKKVKSYIVYEGDDFTLPYMDGFDFVLPKHSPKFKSRKCLYAVYLIKFKDDTIDVSIGTREDVKISLLAHIEENCRYESKYTKELKQQLENATLDEIITQYGDMVIGANGKKLISNKAYTDSNRERMIERKMRNWALRKWSHNLDFSKPQLRQVYEESFDEEERYDKPKDNEVIIEHREQEFLEESGKETIEIKEKGETFIIKEEQIQPSEVEFETVEYTTDEDDLSWSKVE